MKPRHGLIAGLIAASAITHAAELPRALPMPPPSLAKNPDQKSKKEREPVQFVFSLAPKSLQRNPPMEFTVITEMTEAGKKLPPVSPEQPAYYLLHAAGFHVSGSPSGARRPATPADLQEILEKSLSGNGYRPVTQGTPAPSLLIIYSWGTVEDNPLPEAESPEQKTRQFYSRALLVGGEKFLREMITLAENAESLAQNHSFAAESMAGAAYREIMTPEAFENVNPFNLYAKESPRNAFLLDQTKEDMYYVVASAYDYASAAANQRRLLWRTRMTVTSHGLSQMQSMPALIVNAGPFFGKEMTGPEFMVKHAHDGKVEVGVPRVVEPAAEKP